MTERKEGARRAHALEHRVPPPVVAALVAAAMWGLSWLPPALGLPPRGRYTVAAALALVSLALSASGLLAFRQARTTVDPLRPAKASALVTRGVYRFTRNPMYLGIAVLLIAWVVMLDAVWPVLGPVAFVVFIGRFQIAPEERALAARFGGEYSAYAARVRRWL